MVRKPQVLARPIAAPGLCRTGQPYWSDTLPLQSDSIVCDSAAALVLYIHIHTHRVESWVPGGQQNKPLARLAIS